MRSPVAGGGCHRAGWPPRPRPASLRRPALAGISSTGPDQVSAFRSSSVTLAAPNSARRPAPPMPGSGDRRRWSGSARTGCRMAVMPNRESARREHVPQHHPDPADDHAGTTEQRRHGGAGQPDHRQLDVAAARAAGAAPRPAARAGHHRPDDAGRDADARTEDEDVRPRARSTVRKVTRPWCHGRRRSGPVATTGRSSASASRCVIMGGVKITRFALPKTGGFPSEPYIRWIHRLFMEEAVRNDWFGWARGRDGYPSVTFTGLRLQMPGQLVRSVGSDTKVTQRRTRWQVGQRWPISSV